MSGSGDGFDTQFPSMGGNGATIQVGLDADGEAFGDLLADISDEWPRHREAILIAIAEDLVGELKRDAPTNTGRLKGTIRRVESISDRDSMSVVAGGQKGVDYTMSVIEGSRPHPPGPRDPQRNRSLARWADRNNYPGGFYAIYSSIEQYGTEANDFVSSASDRTDRNVRGIVTQVVQKRGIF